MAKDNDYKDVETIIGQSVKVEGEFNADGNVIIEGQVVGKIKTKKDLKAGDSSVIKADIEADNAWIAGEVTGKLTIKNHLELTASAKINGDINTQLLTTETGAKINGNLQMNEASGFSEDLSEAENAE